MGSLLTHQSEEMQDWVAGGPALGYNHLQAASSEFQSTSSRGSQSSGTKFWVGSASTSSQATPFVRAPRRQVSGCKVPTNDGKATQSLRQCVEVRVPYVPPYIPCRSRNGTRSRRRPASQPTASVNGSIVSRYTTEAGKIGFVIIPDSHRDGENATEIEVDLADIYDYVTPAELERYEHHEWDLESERERERRRRKFERQLRAAYSAEEHFVNRPKRPLGRPRKEKSAAPNGPARFVAVHIPSPGKPVTRFPASTSSKAPSDVSQSPAIEITDTTSQPPSSASSEKATQDAPTLNIDQLTPSNANRVIADAPSIADPSPSKGGRSYSMVQAAFSSSDSSADEDAAHGSSSEDELAIDVPTLGGQALNEKSRAMPTTAASTDPSSRQDSIVVQPQLSGEKPNGIATSSSTPKREMTFRKSMTPHFPSAKKDFGPKKNQSPLHRKGHDKEKRSVSRYVSNQDRHQIQMLLGTSPAQSFKIEGAQDKVVGLRGGSSSMNENSSEEDTGHASSSSRDIAPKPILARSKEIVLGDPLNSSPEKAPRPSQPHMRRSSISKSMSRDRAPHHTSYQSNHNAPSDSNTLSPDHRTQSHPPRTTNPLQISSAAKDLELTLGSPITSSSENNERQPQPVRRPSKDAHSSIPNDKKRRRSPENGEQESWYRMVQR